MKKVRVALPAHLRNLARVEDELELEVGDRASIDDLLDALEASYPMLRGTVREYGSGKRRAFMRFFACEQDLSHESQQRVLPDAVLSGEETFTVIGAIAGGNLIAE